MSCTRSGKIYNNTSTLTLEKELRPTFFEPRPTTNRRRSIREETTQLPPKYAVNIDFDDASRAWRANKRRVGESWVYKSTGTETTTGTRTSSRLRNRNK
jgi:hypothetical protein